LGITLGLDNTNRCPPKNRAAASGAKLWASMQSKNIILTDEKGDTANVTIPNVCQSNGVIHAIDTILLPN
jgi:uncharacterized surface protein with fasciclin (FAS1) repeats